MRAVDEDDEENFPLKYLQQRQVLLPSFYHEAALKKSSVHTGS